MNAGGKTGTLAANHAVISDDVARALKVEVGDTLTLSLTVAKARTTQALTGSVVVDEIISGTRLSVTAHARDRSSRGGGGVPDLPGTSSARNPVTPGSYPP